MKTNCFLIAILVTANSFAQDLTLNEAIQIGLENNYSVKIVRNSASMADNNNTLGNAGFLPILTVGAAQNYTTQNAEQQFITDPNPRVIDAAKSDAFSSNATLSWTIFDGLQMFAAKSRLEELERIGFLNIEKAIQNTIRDISVAYYTIILERDRLNILDSSLLLSRDRLSIAKSKYEVGNASKLEYMTAQVDYNADITAKLRQEEMVLQARIELNRLLNRDLEVQFVVRGQIDVDTTLVMENLVQDAMAKNPDLQILRNNISVSSLSLKEIKAERLPTISLNANYNYNKSNSQAGFLISNQTNGYSYGASASWNLFNGFTVNKRAQNARIQMSTNEMVLQDLQNQLNATLLRTYSHYTFNMKLLSLEQENYLVARENSSIAFERYRLGNSNALELREAQLQSVQAAGRLIDASYNTKLAELDLLMLSGNIMESENQN
jgi:outer membrane protein TolC